MHHTWSAAVSTDASARSHWCSRHICTNDMDGILPSIRTITKYCPIPHNLDLKAAMMAAVKNSHQGAFVDVITLGVAYKFHNTCQNLSIRTSLGSERNLCNTMLLKN